MHIAEGFLPAEHAVGWTIAAAPFVVHGARAVVKEVRENPESTLLLGAAGAFTFVMSAIKLPSVTGSSSHPTGTGPGAILFRPPVMALLGTVVLLFQALRLHTIVRHRRDTNDERVVVLPFAGVLAYAFFSFFAFFVFSIADFGAAVPSLAIFFDSGASQ